MKVYSEIYNSGEYHQNNPDWHSSDAQFKANLITSILERNQVAPATICEIGCGNGTILKKLSLVYKNTRFLGIDISQKAIELAKKNTADQIKFEVRDVCAANGALEEKYDVILVIDLIEHLENYFEFLRTIQTKASYTVFHIPLDMSMWTLFREDMLLESKERVGHIHNFTENFICSILNDMGYEIVDKEFTRPNYIPKGFKAKTVVKLRNLLFRMNRRFCTKTIGGFSLLVLAKNKN